MGRCPDLPPTCALNTVRQEGQCSKPSVNDFAGGTATFLIMGPGCTRACPYSTSTFDKSGARFLMRRTAAAGRGESISVIHSGTSASWRSVLSHV